MGISIAARRSPANLSPSHSLRQPPHPRLHRRRAPVRAQSITIHTVGYGREDAEDIADRILPSLLIDIAGSPAGYHQTDNAAGLAEVFRRIAAELGCVGGGWP